MENDPEFIKRFEQFYTVRMSNYPVQDVYLPRGRCIETEAFT
jgi:formylmethanofuran dehydrogenase subunit A